MTTQNVGDGYGSDFSFQSIIIESDRLDKIIEIKNSMTDLDIYEHLDKPYLTGTLTFIDNLNIYSQIDILGAEKVTIKLKSTREDSFQISKTFFVSKVMVAEKGQENVDMIMIHLIEDIAFYSNIQNLNKSYTGNTYDIIQKISNNFLDKNVLVGENKPKQSIKTIIPNLNPLEAMSWLKNRAKTSEGYPFYLFSSLTGDDLLFVDLGTMLSEKVINPYPYRYGEGVRKSNDPNVKRRIINKYIQKDIEDLYTLISKGLIGSQYEYIDVLKNKRRSFHFDIHSDLLVPLADKGVLQQNQPNALYSNDYKLNEKSLDDYNSRVITHIGGIDPYRVSDEDTHPLAYGESRTLADYKLNVISNAMDQLMKKAPMTLDIPGIDFIDGDKQSTVGCQIRIEFPINLPGKAPDAPSIDTKKSGDYLIFAARHKFKIERYDLTLSCLKLANYRSQV